MPVTVKDGRVEFKPPFDPPTLVLEGAKLTATTQGEFVDHWEKIQ
ncbi:MAG TPA: hypothetical protein VGA99_15075 [bacterium]